MKLRFVLLYLCIAITALLGLTGCGGSSSDNATVLMVAYGFPPFAVTPGRQPTFAEIAAADKKMLNDNGINATIHSCVAIEYPPCDGGGIYACAAVAGAGAVLIDVPSADVKSAEVLGLVRFVEYKENKYTYFNCDTR